MKRRDSRHPNRSIGAAVAVLLSLAAAPAPAAPPAIYNLGTLLGGTYSGGLGVNDAGQVAGFSNFQGGLNTHPFRYDGMPGSGGIMRDLYTFGPDSVGTAVNNAGQVAGWWNNAFAPGRHAFRYDGTPGSDGVMYDLGTLGGADARAEAINDSGNVHGRDTSARRASKRWTLANCSASARPRVSPSAPIHRR